MDSDIDGRGIFYCEIHLSPLPLISLADPRTILLCPYPNIIRQHPLGLILLADLKRSDGDKNWLMKPVVSRYVTAFLLLNFSSEESTKTVANDLLTADTHNTLSRRERLKCFEKPSDLALQKDKQAKLAQHSFKMDLMHAQTKNWEYAGPKFAIGLWSLVLPLLFVLFLRAEQFEGSISSQLGLHLWLCSLLMNLWNIYSIIHELFGL